MKERIPLNPNTELKFQNQAHGQMHFVVTEVVGAGGSCIVYNGYYLNNANAKSTVRIKECYPYKLHIQRKEDNSLQVKNGEEEKFSEYKKRIKKSFEVANDLHESSGLTNFTSNIYDIYEANNTFYIVTSYTEGGTLSETEITSLASAVRIVLSVAKCVEKLHNRGYLYLDIKPENIFLFDETYDLIQLFDFDSVIPIGSKEAISDYKLAYSAGFAPLEQRTGNMALIGPNTDIYSLGALLFFMLFGRTPRPTDCVFEAEYDYDGIIFDTRYQNKVYKELSCFFHKTLQSYVLDRYQNMAGAIEQLELILKYADLPVPFICSTYVQNIGTVVGRDTECSILRRWLHSEDNVFFVTGMGGIGKSTIARKFVSDNRNELDNVIYLKYRTSIADTFTDDTQLFISGCERDEAESIKDYFVRKMKVSKELSGDSSTLLIIDNFEGELTEEFTELLKLGWKVLIVTRSDRHGTLYPYMKVEHLKKHEELKELFENNMGSRLKQSDYRKFNSIAEKVFGNTLVLVLIAKQIAKSYITLTEAYHLIENNGFAEIAPEKVDYEQDGKKFYDKISNIIKYICDTSKLSAVEKKSLKLLSMFAGTGISVKDAGKFLYLESLDDINMLKELGWIEIVDNVIHMHPLIQETVYRMEWLPDSREIAVSNMKLFYKMIKSNGSPEDNMKKFYRRNNGTMDTKSFYHILDISKAIVAACTQDDILREETIFKDLLYALLVNLPKDQEDYIIQKADYLLQDKAWKNSYGMMELYDYVIYLLCQKEDYEHARIYLDAAKIFASDWKNHHIWGLFYDMQGNFYESLLDGAYLAQDEDDKNILKWLMESSEKAMKHMKKSKHELAKIYYVKYALSEAALLIRVMPERKKDIKKIINTVIPIAESNTSEYAEVRSVLHMVCAWYYTLSEQNEGKIIAHLRMADKIDDHRKMSDIDRIDYFYIPAANMMCEIEKSDQSIRFLEKACQICDTHKDSLPYIRKKLDLLSYQLEVFWFEHDMDNCRKILHRINAANEEAIEYNITLEIAEEVRKEILV